MTTGTRRLVGGLAVIGFCLVAFDLITGAEWIAFVEKLFFAAVAGG